MIEPGDPYGFGWTFVALGTGIGGHQRIFKVYVGDRLLCGAVVRWPVVVPWWPRAADWHDPQRWVNPNRMVRYDGVNVTSPYFLRRARGNFHLSRNRLKSADLVPVGGALQRISNSGVLRLRFSGGSTHSFVLLGKQDADAICEGLHPGRG